jgi:hypothetical protein
MIENSRKRLHRIVFLKNDWVQPLFKNIWGLKQRFKGPTSKSMGSEFLGVGPRNLPFKQTIVID